MLKYSQKYSKLGFAIRRFAVALQLLELSPAFRIITTRNPTQRPTAARVASWPGQA